MSEHGTISDDGNWWWDADADQWQPVEGAETSSGGGEGSSEGGESSSGGAQVDSTVVADMMTAAEQEASEA